MKVILKHLTIKHWLSDRIFRRLFMNASWLVSGNFLAALIGLANMALTARILGIDVFGVFVLITSYVAILIRLLNFQTWQALIKYGAHAIADHKSGQLKQLVKFCTLLDLSSAIGGAIVGIAAAPFVAGLLHLNAQQETFLILYSIIIASSLAGVPTGVLRLFNRYHTLAFQGTFSACLALAGLSAVWFYKGGLGAVLLTYAIAQIAGNMFLLINGWRALRLEGFHQIWASRLQGIRAQNAGIVGFIFYTNIESSVKILRELDVFIIKLLLSAEAVGIYRVARRLGDTMAIAIDPFFQAIYPELARFAAEKNMQGFKTLMLRSSLLVGGFSFVVFLGFLALGQWFINLVFGPEYAQAYPLAVICILAMVVWALAQPLSPALYTLGHLRHVYYVHLITALSYLALLYAMTFQWGILGAALALLVFYMLWALSMAVICYKKIHKDSQRHGT